MAATSPAGDASMRFTLAVDEVLHYHYWDLRPSHTLRCAPADGELRTALLALPADASLDDVSSLLTSHGRVLPNGRSRAEVLGALLPDTEIGEGQLPARCKDESGAPRFPALLAGSTPMSVAQAALVSNRDRLFIRAASVERDVVAHMRWIGAEIPAAPIAGNGKLEPEKLSPLLGFTHVEKAESAEELRKALRDNRVVLEPTVLAALRGVLAKKMIRLHAHEHLGRAIEHLDVDAAGSKLLKIAARARNAHAARILTRGRQFPFRVLSDALFLSSGTHCSAEVFDVLMKACRTPLHRVVDTQTSPGGFTLLHNATYHGFDTWVHRFLDEDISVRIEAGAGITPLRNVTCSARDKSELVQRLIDKGAVVDKQVLINVARHRHVRSLHVVLRHGIPATPPKGFEECIYTISRVFADRETFALLAPHITTDAQRRAVVDGIQDALRDDVDGEDACRPLSYWLQFSADPGVTALLYDRMPKEERRALLGTDEGISAIAEAKGVDVETLRAALSLVE